jgi:DNA-binding Lrp family transcriptional regulator
MEKFRAKVAEKEGFEFPEMKRVITAFLLINVETGREDRIMEKLFAHKEVQEIHFVPGNFDIIAKIAVEQDYLSSDSEVIGQFLHDKVRRMPGVIKTQTIIPISSKRKRGS